VEKIPTAIRQATLSIPAGGDRVEVFLDVTQEV
jgi:hypothetical protein